MNEKAMNEILEGVIKQVMQELHKVPLAAPVVCSAASQPADGKPQRAIPVELSARHVHLSNQDALALFGAPLTPVRELSQPGQFLCQERVRLIGPKGVIDNVAVLGPARSSSQVEVSMTDARILGVPAPVCQSGDTAGTPGIVLASPKAIINLEEGVIIAARHIHMSCADAAAFQVKDNDKVNVRLAGERPVIFENVLVRVSDTFTLAMHIDPDEGNSCGWNAKVLGKIVGTNSGDGYGCCGC